MTAPSQDETRCAECGHPIHGRICMADEGPDSADCSCSTPSAPVPALPYTFDHDMNEARFADPAPDVPVPQEAQALVDPNECRCPQGWGPPHRYGKGCETDPALLDVEIHESFVNAATPSAPVPALPECGHARHWMEPTGAPFVRMGEVSSYPDADASEPCPAAPDVPVAQEALALAAEMVRWGLPDNVPDETADLVDHVVKRWAMRVKALDAALAALRDERDAYKQAWAGGDRGWAEEQRRLANCRRRLARLRDERDAAVQALAAHLAEDALYHVPLLDNGLTPQENATKEAREEVAALRDERDAALRLVDAFRESEGSWKSLTAENQALRDERDAAVKAQHYRAELARTYGNRWAETNNALRQERAKVEAVRAIHVEHDGHCDECIDGWGMPRDWPCPTISALDPPAAPPEETP